jgi:DNA sulfur modification protein DndD
VADLRLDPETCEPSITTATGVTAPIHGLSAGERQLLAVATLWGLGRVAQRNLPNIIDTPLGRLDSVHRYSLVDDYFPHASQQVILLSTDKEIDAELMERLKPYVSHTVELHFDDGSDSSHIRVGSYFGGVPS